MLHNPDDNDCANELIIPSIHKILQNKKYSCTTESTFSKSFEIFETKGILLLYKISIVNVLNTNLNHKYFLNAMSNPISLGMLRVKL